MVEQSEIRADVDYAIGTFNGYLYTFTKDKILGANICELGPGKNLGIALLFKGLGANESHVVDKYLKPWSEEYHPYFYRALAEAAARNFAGFDARPLLIAAEAGHEKAPIQIWSEDAETMHGIEDASLDFICSNAVLEHLYLPEKAFASFARVTRKGGVGHHQVDFRDHYNFNKPLEFLLAYYRWDVPLSKESFDWLVTRLDVPGEALEKGQIDDRTLIRRMCGYFGNSYRHTDYDELWRMNNFRITSFEANMQAEKEYLDDFYTRIQQTSLPVKELSKDDLGVVSSLYRVIKE